MKILLAEDEPITGRILCQILGEFGACTLVPNGQEAFEIFRESLEKGEPYSLACLDIMLPIIDGQEVLKAIRTLEVSKGIHIMEGIKIIMLTSLKDRKNIIKAFHRGCESYLIKPLDREQILGELRYLGLVRDNPSEFSQN